MSTASKLQSDLELDASKFAATAVTAVTQELNEMLIEMMAGEPKWWEVGPEKYRQMRWNGETPLPKPVVLPSGQDIEIPSREPGRQIPCRVFTPEDGTASKGVFLHIHGGGWVLGTERSQDGYLKFLADSCKLTAVSVGYRLAPEHPFPAPNEDCFDVAEYLVDHAQDKFGVPLLFAGGESAGGHLTACTAIHLSNSRPEFRFKGLILNYGAYDLGTFMPQAYHFKLPVPLVLDVEIMHKYIEAYLPNRSAEQRCTPDISPFWVDLRTIKLPSALFVIGTSDCLLDDSVLMSTKWKMAGAEAILKVYPGGAHGFTLFDPSACKISGEARDATKSYIMERF